MSVVSMEPLLPGQDGELRDLALDLARASARLDGGLAPATRAGLVGLLRTVNSYYSNLIEGHGTHIRLIETALRGALLPGPSPERDLQLLHKAHVEVQDLAEGWADQGAEVASPDFLAAIHREFSERMPASLRVQRSRDGARLLPFDPGQFRDQEVEVGRHLAPRPGDVPALLTRFAAAYDPDRLHGDDRIIAAAAGHHRLTWVHPFADGNGRVARLFTHAWFRRTGLAGYGLWTVSRGLARAGQDYPRHLALADAPRRSDLDGRGALSLEGLRAFCRFFLTVCIDQARFMASLLDLPGLRARMLDYAERRSRGLLPGQAGLRSEAGPLLVRVFELGEVSAPDVPALIGRSARTARDLTGELLAEGLLVRANRKAPLRLGFPSQALEAWFPSLCRSEDTLPPPDLNPAR